MIVNPDAARVCTPEEEAETIAALAAMAPPVQLEAASDDAGG